MRFRLQLCRKSRPNWGVGGKATLRAEIISFTIRFFTRALVWLVVSTCPQSFPIVIPLLCSLSLDAIVEGSRFDDEYSIHASISPS